MKKRVISRRKLKAAFTLQGCTEIAFRKCLDLQRGTGIATGLRGKRSGVWIPPGARDFSPLKLQDWLWAPTSFLFNVYRGSYLGVKQPESDLEHSPPSSQEGVNITLLVLYDFTVWKRQFYLQFYLYLYLQMIRGKGGLVVLLPRSFSLPYY